MSDKPHILLIDDEAQLNLLPSGIGATLARPEDSGFADIVTTAALRSDLILLDHNLQLPSAFSLQANDGASLLGHLRSWARAQGHSLPPVVIYTSEDEAYREEVPAIGPSVALNGSFKGREHFLAPVLDVEWLITKGENHAKAQISAIASASARLKVAAGNERVSSEELATYLGMPTQPAWVSNAKERLALSRPPLTEPTSYLGPDGARGIAPTIRWLLQRALAFPGLFVSDLYLAWMLGIEPDLIDQILQQADHKDWAKRLADGAYQGPAKELFSRRWWAPAVDYVAWQLRSQMDDSNDRKAVAKDLTGLDLSFFENDDQVVAFDTDLNESGLIRLDSAVQLHPRGWPVEALEPWMTRADAAREPLLWATVDQAERAEAGV